ncbi:hypothetical protein [Granulicella sp. L46]|uniref:hypothetical protein n=1 Tax=Granulicella sp. L46 TaxID=1641865 RepID=UPI00131E16DF|nr:hypothetical protein [Granulicella sp. L46]
MRSAVAIIPVSDYARSNMASNNKVWNASDALKLVAVGAVILGVIAFLSSHERPPQDQRPLDSQLAPETASQSSATDVSYLCDAQSYRQKMLDDALEDVEEHSGDKFDKEAARKRVLATPYATLESERLGDLAFVRKTYREANDTHQICPNQ